LLAVLAALAFVGALPFVGFIFTASGVGRPPFVGACASAIAPFGAVQRTSDSSGTPPVGDQRWTSSEPAPSQ
jgi:hypothetical protein